MTEEQVTTETLLIALQNLYVWMAEYYPSSVKNSPPMIAACELIRAEIETMERTHEIFQGPICENPIHP